MSTEHENLDVSGPKPVPNTDTPLAKWTRFTARPTVNRPVAKPSGNRHAQRPINAHGSSGNGTPVPSRNTSKGGGKGGGGRPKQQHHRGQQRGNTKQIKLPQGMGDYDDIPPDQPMVQEGGAVEQPTQPSVTAETGSSLVENGGGQAAAEDAAGGAPLPPQEKLPDLYLTDLQKMDIAELHALIPHANQEDLSCMRKHDVIFEVIRSSPRGGGGSSPAACSRFCPTGSGSCARRKTITCNARRMSTSRRRRSAVSGCAQGI